MQPIPTVRAMARLLVPALSTLVLAALCVLLIQEKSHAQGTADPQHAILFELDWSGASDVVSPLPRGWEVRQGALEHFSVMDGALGEEGRFLRIHNEVGSPRILYVPVENLPRTGRLLWEIEFGVEPFVGGGDAFFTVIGGIIDLRVRASDGQLALLDLDRNRTPLGKYEAGRFMNVRFEIDLDAKSIARVWVDGALLTDFPGMPWRRSNVLPGMELIATTPSGADIYWKRVVVMVSRSSEERAGERASGSPAQADGQGGAVIPTIGPLITGRVNLISDREWLSRALDLNIKREALARPFPVELFFTAKELQVLPDRIASTPAMAATWAGIAESVRQVLLSGTFPLGSRPYTYTLGSRLPELALAYLLTGNERLGEFLRVVLLDVADRPMEFWIHAELRAYNPQRPVGGLETATLARGVAMALNWAFDVFTPEEREKVREALREKGLVPSLRWLANARMNNWRAVMSAGAYIAAKVLGDEEAMAVAEAHLRDYVRVVEDDGSYGEQIGYFEYGISSLIPGLAALEIDAVRDVVTGSGLARSLEWMAYYYGFADAGAGKLGPGRINFGDDDFPGSPDPTVAYFLANAAGNGLGTWLIERFHGRNVSGDWLLFVLLAKFDGAWPEPAGPEALGLQTVRAFENGVGVIRSSWEPDGVVVGIRSGGASRTGYAHDRPDRNGIALFAGGEYLVVTPGRASYRSPIRESWDLRTSSHNTLTFDGQSQIREPQASIVAVHAGEHVDYLASEAASSYPNKPERVRRHLLFVKEPGYLVILDEVIAGAGDPAPVDLHFHFNNHDGRGALQQVNDAEWRFDRPKASLQLFGIASEPVERFVEPGRMHKGYSYYPGDPNEGAPGTSIKLRTSTQEAVTEVRFYTVLLPVTGGGAGAAIQAQTGDGEASVTVDHGTYVDSFVFRPIEGAAGHSGGSSEAGTGVAAGVIEFSRRRGDTLIAREVWSLN